MMTAGSPCVSYSSNGINDDRESARRSRQTTLRDVTARLEPTQWDAPTVTNDGYRTVGGQGTDDREVPPA